MQVDREVSLRALEDLNPPGVPDSFRRMDEPDRNIASIIRDRETGGRSVRLRFHGHDAREGRWAELQSTQKVS